MIEIELNKINKNYGLKNVLEDFCLEVNSKERVALIGPNGCGKSTVLKVIAKQEVVDGGIVNIRSGAKIGILNQIYENEKEMIRVKKFLYRSFEEILNFEKRMNDLTNKMSFEQDSKKLEKLINEFCRIQEKFSLIGGYTISEKFNKICSKCNISEKMLDMDYNLLSGGEKTRVNLAKLLLAEPDILLLDEPTNHLDMESSKFLEEFLLSYKGTILMVSHDRYFLDKVATKTILIEGGKANVYYGNYSYFLEEDEKRVLIQFENYKNQKKQIEKMKESIEKLRKFGALAGNEMFFKRAKSIEKRLAKMEIIEKVDLNKKPVKLSFDVKYRAGNDVLKIENLSKSFDGKIIFNEANLNLSYGEKVALVGKNGSGKSTLLKIVLGYDRKYEGNVQMGTAIKVGYIPQNIMFEKANQTVFEYFINASGFSETEARSKLYKYGFRNENVFKQVGRLSGGEKVRLLLVKLIQKDINFLVLDEPTNHIDIDTREILEEALEQYKGTLLFVSHDRYFINKVANRVINIEDFKLKSYAKNI